MMDNNEELIANLERITVAISESLVSGRGIHGAELVAEQCAYVQDLVSKQLSLDHKKRVQGVVSQVVRQQEMFQAAFAINDYVIKSIAGQNPHSFLG